MNKIKFYQITEEQFLNTEYRPLGVETTEIETEDGWNLADVLENQCLDAEVVKETSDLIIVKVVEDEEVQYFVEVI